MNMPSVNGVGSKLPAEEAKPSDAVCGPSA
jgi:hypothetical protein